MNGFKKGLSGLVVAMVLCASNSALPVLATQGSYDISIGDITAKPNAGAFDVSVPLTMNNNYSDGWTAILAVANDGSEDLSFVSIVDKTSAVGNTVNFTSVPLHDNGEVTVYVWDGFDTITPLAKSVTEDVFESFVAKNPTTNALYSSLETAISDASTGQTVELLDDVTIATGSTLAVPTGVILKIPEGKKMTVEGTVNISGTLLQEGGNSTVEFATEGVLELNNLGTLNIETGGLWSVKTGLVGNGTATIKSGACYFNYGSEISDNGTHAASIIHESGSSYYYGAVTNGELPTTIEDAKSKASAKFLEPGAALGAPTNTTVRWILGEGAKLKITRSSSALISEIITNETNATQWGQIKPAADYNTIISGTGKVEIPAGITITTVADQTITVNSGAQLEVAGTLAGAGTLEGEGTAITSGSGNITITNNTNNTSR